MRLWRYCRPRGGRCPPRSESRRPPRTSSSRSAAPRGSRHAQDCRSPWPAVNARAQPQRLRRTRYVERGIAQPPKEGDAPCGASMEDADHGSIGRRALILRVEIESLGEQLASLLVNDAQLEPLPEDDARAREIAEAEAQLEEQRARLQAEAERLDRLATELAEREAAAGGLTAAQRIRIAHGSWQAHETQRALHDEDVDAARE